MSAQINLAVRTILALMVSALAACATSSRPFDHTLGEYCDLSASGLDQNRQHVARGRLVLAAITGYGYRTIDLLAAKSESPNDAALALISIKKSYIALEKAKDIASEGMFPVYRADYVDELARTAAIAAQPAIRAARTLVTGNALSRLTQAGPVLGSLVEDELYVAAYKDACTKLGSVTNIDDIDKQANQRIKMRCISLVQMTAADDTRFDKKTNAYCDFVKP